MKTVKEIKCPFCGKAMFLQKNGPFKYSIKHVCDSGLVITVPCDRKKHVLSIINARAK
jgi:hypothetical protein